MAKRKAPKAQADITKLRDEVALLKNKLADMSQRLECRPVPSFMELLEAAKTHRDGDVELAIKAYASLSKANRSPVDA